MKLKKLYVLFFLVITFVCMAFTGCKMSMRNSETDGEEEKVELGQIEGKAFYSNSDDCSGIVITLESTDGLRAASVIQSISTVNLSSYERAVIDADRAVETSYITKSDGKYSFSNLTPGTYTVYASSKDSMEKAVSANVVVQSNSTVTVDDLKLTATGEISGIITIDNSSKNNYGFIVYVAGTSYSAMTDDTGNFRISGIPAGNNYSVIISRGSFLYFWRKGVMVRAGQTLSLDDKNFSSDELNVGIVSGNDGADGKDGVDGKDGIDGKNGVDGKDGKDGTSIVWRGSFASEKAISNPQKMNAYFNTTDGCSYIYDGEKWTLLAKAGVDGENGKDGENGSDGTGKDGSNGKDGIDGKDGTSIVWLGSYASANEIENPQTMNAYFNTSDGCSYIYDGEKWNLLAKSGNTEIYNTSLEISSLPTKMNYFTNETLDLSGLEVHMNKTDGTSSVLLDNEYTVYPENGTVLTESGSKIVKIISDEKSGFFIINIEEKPVVTIENIVLNTTSVNRYYGKGESLDLSALKVTALYSDGTSSELTNYTSIPENGSVLNNLGLQTITILADGKSTSFDIQVLPDSSICAQVSYEVYSDIANLMSYDSISHSFTALPNYDSYRWYVDDVKQKETSNIFIYEDCKYHTVMVIVNAAGANYSAQIRIE